MTRFLSLIIFSLLIFQTTNFLAQGISYEITNQDANQLEKSKTLDVVTWNLEWFGVPGKSKNATSFNQQLSEVSSTIISLDADIYALQEVVVDDLNGDFLTPLVEKLNQLAGERRYVSVLAPKYSFYFNTPSTTYPAQRLCFIYNVKTVGNIQSFSMFEDVYNGGTTNSIDGYTANARYFWSSGRLPQLMKAIVSIDNKSEIIDFINIHAKCCSDSEDRRVADAGYLFNFMLAQYPVDNIVVAGDYNDDVNSGSPYSGWYSNNFQDFKHIAGIGIDHISISNELYDENEALINNVNIGESTVSDHDPVMIRLLLNSSKSPQIILMNEIEDQDVEIAITLSSSNSSGLPVEYRIVKGGGVITDNELLLTKGGETILQAINTGNDTYAPSFSNTVVFNVIKKSQTIDFAEIPTKKLSDEPFELSATASSGLPISFTVEQGNASILGKMVTIKEPGEVIIKATQKGSDIYEATFATQTFLVEDKSGIEDEMYRGTNVYPNPATNSVKISMWDNESHMINITDIIGVTRKSLIGYNNQLVDISDLKEGVYLVEIQYNHKAIVKRLVIKR